MLTDLRYAFRQLAKSRGFAFIAVFTLAVGIGASTAMFSTLRALVVHPFDYPESDEIVQVWSSGNGNRPLSPADFHDLHDQMTAFEHFGVHAPSSVMSVGKRAGDSRRAHDAIISYKLWQQTFASDASLIGRSIRINGGDATVIGVMPPDFEFAAPWMRSEDCQIWLPYRFTKNELTQRDSHWLNGVARGED